MTSPERYPQGGKLSHCSWGRVTRIEVIGGYSEIQEKILGVGILGASEEGFTAQN